MNSIQNCPVTITDVDLAEKIFGKDIASLKGKTTRSKPAPVVQDIVDIPHKLIAAQHDVDLCFDTMYINELPFLATISRRIMYRTIEWLPEENSQTYAKAINKVIKIYKQANFKVVSLSCDREYTSLMERLEEDHQVKMNYARCQC